MLPGTMTSPRPSKAKASTLRDGLVESVALGKGRARGARRVQERAMPDGGVKAQEARPRPTSFSDRF
ncbi:hypothetical protein GCM10010260_52560 [Streptomyces filipinensis]|uniref:Uncharacterized protein n=1 Tax=Streptomyces filipinensis TaxID=66887 RepID=A0A918IEL8_9ACTN|nr:hypothetical protein GCM10010260_52560 [Streptomyces filipinensis]